MEVISDEVREEPRRSGLAAILQGGDHALLLV
jgi:hypothetical protein